MADLTSYIATICHRAIVDSEDKPLGADNIFSAIAFYKRMLEGNRLKKQGGGYQIYSPIEYKINNNIRWIDTDTPIPSGTVQKRTMALVDWREIGTHIVLDGMTYIVKNAGKEALMDGIKAEIENAKYGISEVSEQGLLSAGGVPAAGTWIVGGSTQAQFDGLGVILSTTLDYAGISVAQLGTDKDGNNIWAAQIDSTVTTLTMVALMNQINKQKGMRSNPTVILTTEEVQAKIWSIMQALERYTSKNSDVLTQEDFSFGKRPVLTSDYVTETSTTAHDLIVLDEKYLKLVLSPYRMPEISKPIIDTEADVSKIRVLLAGNLICTNRRAQGKFTAINPSA